jgi:hypothetical protein
MKRTRQAQIKQLEIGIKHCYTIRMPPTRLSKFPVGMKVLADRGFAPCSPYYPFLNPIIMPFFLDGRAQFTFDGISADREKCQLQYPSEAIFGCVTVTMNRALHDKIPWNFLAFTPSCQLGTFDGQFTYSPGRDQYFTDGSSSINTDGYLNYIDYAVPIEFMVAGLQDAGVLKERYVCALPLYCLFLVVQSLLWACVEIEVTNPCCFIVVFSVYECWW